MSELGTMYKLLGPRKMLRNVRTMKCARSRIRGYGTTMAYWALMRSGFIGALEVERKVSPAEFCESRNVDPEILQYLIQYLERLGHLRARKDHVSFSRKGKKFWEQVNGVFNIFCAYQPFFANLEPFLRREITKESQKRDDDFVALGFRETGASVTFAAMANLIKRKGFTSMIELGCGNIDLSLYVSRILPEIRFLGIDFDDHYLDEARATVEAESLSGRVELLKHDIFGLTPDVRDFSSYELVTAIDLFHGYYYEGREKLLQLFRALRTTFPGKKFLISEMCLADEQRMKGIAYPMVEHELFHNLTGQKTFAGGELESLLEEAGFKVVEAWPVRNLAARLFLLFE